MQAWPLADSLPLDASNDTSSRLGELFDRHHPPLYRLARRLSRTREDALDLVQDTFLRAAQHLNAIPSGSRQEEAWLVRVLVNMQRDRWRRRQVRDRHEEDERTSPTAAQSAGNEDAAVTSAVVWQALGRLTPRRRAVVVLYELEGRGSAEIASLLGISRVTVRWHLARGRRELAAWLKPLNVPPGRMR